MALQSSLPGVTPDRIQHTMQQHENRTELLLAAAFSYLEGIAYICFALALH
jgi:hypothetical protein